MDALTKAILTASPDELSLYILVFVVAMVAGFLTSILLEHWND